MLPRPTHIPPYPKAMHWVPGAWPAPFPAAQETASIPLRIQGLHPLPPSPLPKLYRAADCHAYASFFQTAYVLPDKSRAEAASSR